MLEENETPLLSGESQGASDFPGHEAGQQKVSGVGASTVSLMVQLGAAANILNCLIGTGLLSMPRGFAEAGVVAALLSLVPVAYFSYRSALLIVKLKLRLPGSSGNLLDIGAYFAGSAGKTCVACIVVLAQLGLASSYLTFLAEALNTLTAIGTRSALAVVFPVASLLQLIRRMENLAYVSVISSAALVFSIFAIFYQGASITQRDGWPEGPSDRGASNFGGLLIARTFPTFFGCAVLALCAHASVPAIAESLETAGAEQTHHVYDGHHRQFDSSDEQNEWDLLGPSESEQKQEDDFNRFSHVAAWSFGCATVLYAAVGLGGLLLYGQHVSGILVDSFGFDFIGIATRVALSIVCLTTMPVQLYPVVSIAEELFLHIPFLRLYEGSCTLMWLRNLVRTMCVFIPLLFALSVPCFSQIISLVGSFAIATMVFILPPLLCLLLKWNRAQSLSFNENALDYCSIAIGAAGCITGTVLTTSDLVHGECDS